MAVPAPTRMTGSRWPTAATPTFRDIAERRDVHDSSFSTPQCWSARALKVEQRTGGLLLNSGSPLKTILIVAAHAWRRCRWVW
jgi:hypothetical protein